MLLAPCSAKLRHSRRPGGNLRPWRRGASCFGQVARLASKTRAGNVANASRLRKRLLVGYSGDCKNWLLAPAIGRPTLGHDAALQYRQSRTQAGRPACGRAVCPIWAAYTRRQGKARINRFPALKAPDGLFGGLADVAQRLRPHGDELLGRVGMHPITASKSALVVSSSPRCRQLDHLARVRPHDVAADHPHAGPVDHELMNTRVSRPAKVAFMGRKND